MIFEAINSCLRARANLMREGTLVDATLIDAPRSTKNRQGAREPEMTSTKNGNAWYFGMKANVGVDLDSGAMHMLETSTAKVHDSRKFDDPLRTATSRRCSAKRVISAASGRRHSAPGARSGAFGAKTIHWIVFFTLQLREAPKRGRLHPIDARIDRIVASPQAKVEQPFRVVKCQFGYSGLAKNQAQRFSLFGLIVPRDVV